MPGVDDFDDEEEDLLGQGDELDDIDAQALQEAVASAASVTDDPDIDTPGAPGGSQAPDHANAPVPETPQLADILAGRAPVFLVHKSYQQWQRIPEILEVARRVTRGHIGLGTVVRLPQLTTTAANAFLGSCAHAALRIADPEVFTLPGSGSPAKQVSARQINQHPWAAGIPGPTATPAQRDGWMREVFDAQLAAGANVLLSPTGWVTDTQAPTALQATMVQVAHARQALGGDPMFVNLTLAGAWLSNTRLRQMLLQEIVESNEPLWYIRVRWPIVEPRYGQLVDPAMLDGYKDLALTAALEGKALVLPNSGLTGWLATALGASGFSTGMSWTEQAFAEQRRYGRPPAQPGPPPAQRYFERAVLHPLLWADAQNLTQVQGYGQCQCRYCMFLRANGFDKEVAGAHYLVRGARLLDEFGSANRRLEALRIVRAAEAFVSGLANTPNALSGKWLPGHLPLWGDRLK